MANELSAQTVKSNQSLQIWPARRDSNSAGGHPGVGGSSQGSVVGKVDPTVVLGVGAANPTQGPGVTSQTTSGAKSLIQEQTKSDANKAERDAKLRESVKKINDYVQSMRRELQFSVDKDTELTVVKVVNPTNSEIIRQIPSVEVLDLAKRLTELTNEGEKAKAVSGLLLETQA